MKEFKISGLEELLKAFKDLPDDAIKNLEPAADQAGDLLLTRAKQKVPVESGKLKSSLCMKKPTTGRFMVSRVITWGDDVREYAAPVELGHKLVLFGRSTDKRVKERPFLRPAADESKNEVFKIMKQAIAKTIDEMGGVK